MKKIHVGIILDGNRRWSVQNNVSVFAGVDKGTQTALDICQSALDSQLISHLTLWILSGDNVIKRDHNLIRYLVHKLQKTIIKEQKQFIEKNIDIDLVGDLSILDFAFLEQLKKIKNQICIPNLTLYIAVNYSGKQEILSSTQNVCKLLQKEQINKISQEKFSQCLYIPHMPDFDIIIRTGNVQRLSGFFPWHSGYAELFFPKKLWPDFNKSDFDSIMKRFELIKRNFGA